MCWCLHVKWMLPQFGASIWSLEKSRQSPNHDRLTHKLSKSWLQLKFFWIRTWVEHCGASTLQGKYPGRCCLCPASVELRFTTSLSLPCSTPSNSCGKPRKYVGLRCRLEIWANSLQNILREPPARKFKRICVLESTNSAPSSLKYYISMKCTVITYHLAWISCHWI